MKQWLVSLCVCHVYALFSQQWLPMSDFPGGGRDDGTVFVAGGKAYCGLGMNAWFGCNGDFYAFDTDSESWSPVSGLPAGEERQYACGFALGGKGYVFGGIDGSGNYLSDLWQYDPDSDTWTEQASLPGAGRAGMMSFVIGETAYVAGGKTAAQAAVGDVWSYDPASNVWIQRADLPAASWRGVAFSWNGLGITGLGKDAAGSYSGSFFSYDPVSDSWEQIQGLNLEATTYTSAARIGPMAFLYGGTDASGAYLNHFTRIDLNTYQSWQLAPFPGDARRGGMAFAGDEELYLTTGVSASGRLSETWKAAYILSMDEAAQDPGFELYPNPGPGAFQIRSSRPVGTVHISDITGKTAFRQVVPGTGAWIETQLPAGLYLVSTGASAVKLVIR